MIHALNVNGGLVDPPFKFGYGSITIPNMKTIAEIKYPPLTFFPILVKLGY